MSAIFPLSVIIASTAEWAENLVEYATSPYSFFGIYIFYKIQFRPGLHPRLHWRTYDAPLDTLIRMGRWIPFPSIQSTLLDTFDPPTFHMILLLMIGIIKEGKSHHSPVRNYQENRADEVGKHLAAKNVIKMEEKRLPQHVHIEGFHR